MRTALLRWMTIVRHDPATMIAAASPNDPTPSGLLADLALFQGLPDAEMAEMAAGVRRSELAVGRCAYRAGEAAEALYLVVEGRLEIFKQEVDEDGNVEERRVGAVGPGDLFGEAAILADRAHSSEVRAIEPSRLLIIPRRTLDAFFQRHPSRRLRLRTLSVTRRLASVSAAFKG